MRWTLLVESSLEVGDIVALNAGLSGSLLYCPAGFLPVEADQHLEGLVPNEPLIHHEYTSHDIS